MSDKLHADRVPPLPVSSAMPPYRFKIEAKGRANGVAAQSFDRDATGHGILQGSNLAG
jgi:hypothetical protein